jgi:hypothetical protein
MAVRIDALSSATVQCKVGVEHGQRQVRASAGWSSSASLKELRGIDASPHTPRAG